MLHITLFGILALVLGASAGSYPPDVVDNLAAESIIKLKDYIDKNPIGGTGNCTLQNAAKRYEWSDLSIMQRQEYVQAVLCLMSLPAKTKSQAPGARTRFDDYVVVHIQKTPIAHNNAFFLPWHRYYIWHYEQALRNECGYTGYQPYWNWDRYADDPINSPLFNGNDSSIGGNGAYYKYDGISIIPNKPVPPGIGGGCMTSGPFMNLTVNVGPLSQSVPGVPPNPQADGLGYNPRCIRRDVNKNYATLTRANYTYDLITKNNNVYWMQTVMEGQLDMGLLGVHISGHQTIGGDPAGDFYSSPGDPAFWLHHGMIDRVWWIWQNLDLEKRLKDVSMTMTMFNNPPTRNGTLEDSFDLGLLAGEWKMKDLMSTLGGLGGEMCYVYV